MDSLADGLQYRRGARERVVTESTTLAVLEATGLGPELIEALEIFVLDSFEEACHNASQAASDGQLSAGPYSFGGRWAVVFVTPSLDLPALKATAGELDLGAGEVLVHRSRDELEAAVREKVAAGWGLVGELEESDVRLPLHHARMAPPKA